MSTYAARQELIARMTRGDLVLPVALARMQALRRPTPPRRLATSGKLIETVISDPLEADEGTGEGGEGSLENGGRSAPSISQLTRAVRGRLVRADEPNLNGAYFSREDLEFGLASLAGAPLTWNHVQTRGAYGWITRAELAEHDQHGYHIDIGGAVWAGRFPEIADSLARSVARKVASLSMECMASKVGCMATGCGIEAASLSEACEHIAQRTAPRRQIEPTFFGAALILDGVKPGWPGASLQFS